MTMLEVYNLSATYGQHPALNEVSLTVGAGEIVVILGANGAGKSTLLRAISGICEGKVSGHVMLKGEELTGLDSNQIVEYGVALVPEGRAIFGDLTVKENLLLGAYSSRARPQEAHNLDRVLTLFPKLTERQNQIARTMSGGEQQMVAIGRAMMSAPDILMLDEPSLGLSPLLCKELFQNLSVVKDLGIGVLLVEQNAKQSLAISNRGYLLENTRITREDSAERLRSDPSVQKAFLGAGVTSQAKPASPAASDQIRIQDIPFTAGPSTPRRSAEQQIGASIDDLVNAATAASAKSLKAPSERAVIQAKELTQSRVEIVLKDIEAAAAAAHQRKQGSSVSISHLEAQAKPVEDLSGPPPIIEVYKRPRVEVYRRRSSGHFERD
jgi:branched-chain amino acid transport system ATP-binding protein